MRWIGAALAALTLALGGAAGAAPSASATPPPLMRGLSDGGLLASPDASQRRVGQVVAGTAQARIARIPIAWSTVVGSGGYALPAGAPIPRSDPAHPIYRWERIDQALRELAARGLTPMVYLLAAPSWAESAPRYRYAPPGTWAPRPELVAEFASAVARRYDGTYPDPLRPGSALPRVAHFQSWNEPNLGRYLQPLWVPGPDGRPRLFAAGWYRAMHRAVDQAIRARQPGAQVGLAGLASGSAARDGDGRVAPIRFLRSVLCVGDERPADCGAPLRVDAVALHPLSVGNPDLPATWAEDVAVADLESKLAATLDAATRKQRLAGRRPALWITELNWTASATAGIPAPLQGLVIGRAVRRLWQAGASIVNWQFAADPDASRTNGTPRLAGLTQAPAPGSKSPGRAKAFLAGFTVPTVAVPIGGGRTYLWVLTPGGEPNVRIERRSAGSWLALRTLPVRAGVAEAIVRLPVGAEIRAVAGAQAGAVVPVRRHVGLSRWGRRSAPQPDAERSQTTSGTDDPRDPDPDGPGRFAPSPPLLPGGLAQRRGEGAPARTVRNRRGRTATLDFRTQRGLGVILGTPHGDRFSGRATLIVGFGGADRRR